MKYLERKELIRAAQKYAKLPEPDSFGCTHRPRDIFAFVKGAAWACRKLKVKINGGSRL